MIDALDRRFAKIFAAVLKLLCKATGRDNFFFAEGAAIVSASRARESVC